MELIVGTSKEARTTIGLRPMQDSKEGKIHDEEGEEYALASWALLPSIEKDRDGGKGNKERKIRDREGEEYTLVSWVLLSSIEGSGTEARRIKGGPQV